ncbi:MAG: PH domain-containing protein [Verrucomicrobiaceae bacterium]|nr:PH domain-containing protein [Verrucomicrobiaceae bacterium]
MPEETSLWKGCTSQLVYFWTYLIWIVVAGGVFVAGILLALPLLFAALVLPLIGVLWRYLVTRTTTYELTTQRLRKTSGIFSKTLDELELYRVKDSTLEQPFLLRVFGLGNVMIISSDATMPDVFIYGIPGAFEVREKLRVAVESERDRKRVREVDFAEEGSGHPGQ